MPEDGWRLVNFYTLSYTNTQKPPTFSGKTEKENVVIGSGVRGRGKGSPFPLVSVNVIYSPSRNAAFYLTEPTEVSQPQLRVLFSLTPFSSTVLQAFPGLKVTEAPG